MRIADFSIRRPVFAVMLTGALVALGLISVGRLGVDLFPKIEMPYMAVTTLLEGATPETIETEISDVLEDHLSTISGLEELRSISSEGVSQVFLQFELEEDADVKSQDVRDKVARARADLPTDAEPPVVEKVDPDAAPILSVMVSGDLPIRELSRFADDVVKERVQRVPGVGSATLVGGREREIRVWIDGRKLRAYGLTVDDVVRALRTEHAEIPGGRMETLGADTEFSVKTMGEVETVEEFRSIVVAFRDGAPTRVGDIARVEDGLEDERSYAELNGVRGVSLEVRRQSGRNTVQVARGVEAAVSEIQESAPPGVRVVMARDVSRFVEASARDVGVDIVLGGVLAVLVTLVFLRSVRTTLIVSLAIPTSIVSTFFLFYVMDFTLNILTLMALSVSIGLLIDDAIVVLESIQSRIEEGEDPMHAASTGTERVGAAVLAGTAAVLAVFIPIAFMQGVIGRFFYEYGLAISFAVAVSLLVAVTLTPALCSRVLRQQQTHGRIFETLERFYSGLERAYGRLLEAALRRRFTTLAVAAVSVWIGLVMASGVPLAFSGRVDRSEFEGRVELPLGTGIGESKRAAARVSEALAGVEHIRNVFVSIGGGAQGNVHEIDVYAGLTPKAERSVGMLEIMDHARLALGKAVPRAKLVSVNEVSFIQASGFTSYNMEYGIRGSDLDALRRTADSIVAGMRADPHFVDAKSSFEFGKPEIQIRVDRNRAADQAVPVQSLATTVRALVGGLDAVTFEEGGKRYDVRVRLESAQRDDLSELGRIQIRSARNRLIDLANVAELKVAAGPAQIERENRARKVSIYANNPEGVALGTGADRLDEIAAAVGLPAGLTSKHEGMTERMKDSAEAVVFAFFLALLALYMILASQFNSFVQPGIIMLTAPLSFAGAFVALRLTGTSMSIFAQIGLVALMGLVMKNGILLVDYANQLRVQGRSAREAMSDAGPARLRPVLMTAVSTIAGMVPVAISTSDAAEWRNPMGILVIGGLATSTLLTLVVVPVAYTLAADAGQWPARAAVLVRRPLRKAGEGRSSPS